MNGDGTLIERLRGGDDLATRIEAADKIDGLEEDLRAAVEVAYRRGATEWVRLNYPANFARLSGAD